MSDSPSNRLLRRTWMLSKHRYNPRELGNVMKVKETPPHALSHANTEASEDQEKQDQRELEARGKFDELDDLDREILRLHLHNTGIRDHVATFPKSQRDELEKAGWFFRKETSRGARVEMVRSYVGKLTYDEIAGRVGCSTRTVQRRLSAMDPVLVKFAELRGWCG